MRHVAISWVAGLWFAAGAFAGCSDDESGAVPAPDAGGGSGGSAGSAGSGGSASGRGGAAGTGGTGNGGVSGAGTGGTGSNVDASGGSAGAVGSSGTGGAPGGFIRDAYPNDVGIAADPRVIFHSDFERDFEGWTRHTNDSTRIAVLNEAGLANSGTKYLRAQVTRTALAADQNISANAQHDFSRRVPQMYFRFHARFVGNTAIPHHWVRIAAGDSGYASDGLANTVPPGDGGFWYDLDVRRDLTFNFYVYWYKMRSGRCNDGTTVPGCAGDQGTTYHYGNNFTPAGQSPFARDAWFCLEVFTKANTVGQSDGELALYVNDALAGEYKPGVPRGRWLRDNFYSWGQYFEDVQAFEGFDFRSSADVLLKRITLDAYYQKDTLDELAATTPVPEAQVILYDDVVVATERIGCRAP